MLSLSLSRLRNGLSCMVGAAALWCISSPDALAQLQPNADVSAPLGSSSQVNPDNLGYMLGPGDQLDITVLGYEEYTRTATVLPDGTITLPLLGDVMASGKTAQELAEHITAMLNPLLIDPAVTVQPVALRPILITVAGEVQRPGPLEIQNLAFSGNGNRNNEDEFRSQPTVSLAIAEAGGVTRNADIREIVINREMPGGDSERIVIDLWDAVWSDNPNDNVMIRDGDSIFVPPLDPGEQFDRRLLASSSLAPDTIRVRVVGEVTAPGEVLVPPNSSISSAVAIAGGPTRDARLKEVAFIRLNDVGEIEPQVVDLRDLSDSYQVQEGDVVVVPARRSTSILDFAALILNPLDTVIDILRD